MTILAMMPVRNEAGRYLPTVLRYLSQIAAGIVVLDDASNDATPEICSRNPKIICYHRLPEPLFEKNEAALRRQLWEMTVSFNPKWILALDADEIFEMKALTGLPLLYNQDEYALIRFPVLHFWQSFSHYRVDGAWDPLFSKIGCLYRYRQTIPYHWTNRKLHCGRFPEEAYTQPTLLSGLRLLHLGYARREDLMRKYLRYHQIDHSGTFCPSEHYRSILEQPRLKQWHGTELREIDSSKDKKMGDA